MNANKQSHSQPIVVKKNSRLKRNFILLLVVSALGGAGYFAYQQGAIDQYLPRSLKALSEASISPLNTASTTSSVNSSVTVNDVTALIGQLQGGSVVAESSKPIDGGTVMISVNGSPANALLNAYDAQWQWQIVEQDFKQRADVTMTLQRVKSIKEQLEVTHSAAFLPALSALNQVESQLQTWNSLPINAYLTALEQTVSNVDNLVIKAVDNVVETEEAAQVISPSLWQQVLTSLRGVIEIKRTDEAKNMDALTVGTAAVVQQAIAARLSLGLLAAHNGQWQQAQNYAKAAQKLAVDWSNADGLATLKPFIEVNTFPSTPDFNVVSAALMQARLLLTNEARSAATLATPVTPILNKGGAS